MSNNFKVGLASKLLVFLYSSSEKSFTVFSPNDPKNYYNNQQEHQHVQSKVEEVNPSAQTSLLLSPLKAHGCWSFKAVFQHRNIFDNKNVNISEITALLRHDIAFLEGNE